MSANKGLFAKYPNRVFIETGCLHGNGIQQALDEGFEMIYSIELLYEYFYKCSERFKHNLNVLVVLGDSRFKLEPVLRLIDEPCTFWLDAHIGSESSPLLEELRIIKEHPIKTHTILIDDLRDWKMKRNGFDTSVLIEKLKEINPEYKIEFEDGYKPKDILVARI